MEANREQQCREGEREQAERDREQAREEGRVRLREGAPWSIEASWSLAQATLAYRCTTTLLVGSEAKPSHLVQPNVLRTHPYLVWCGLTSPQSKPNHGHTFQPHLGALFLNMSVNYIYRNLLLQKVHSSKFIKKIDLSLRVCIWWVLDFENVNLTLCNNLFVIPDWCKALPC